MHTYVHSGQCTGTKNVGSVKNAEEKKYQKTAIDTQFFSFWTKLPRKILFQLKMCKKKMKSVYKKMWHAHYVACMYAKH